MVTLELTCRNCGWRTVCGRADAVARLRLVGLLRRDKNPEDGLLAALLVDAAPRMTCPICKEKRLGAREQEPSDEDDADWQSAVLCEICRQPIPPERLEALPGAKRCVACQQQSEANPRHAEPVEYCPHCGALVELRASRGPGITRYKRFCTGVPPCRL